MNPLKVIKHCWLHILISIGYTMLYWYIPKSPMFTSFYFFLWLTVTMFLLGEANNHNHMRMNERKVVRFDINPKPKTRITTTVKAWSLFIVVLVKFYTWLAVYA